MNENAILAAAMAVMQEDVCGFTFNEERVFCDDARVPDEYRQGTCSCKKSARAAVTAYQAATPGAVAWLCEHESGSFAITSKYGSEHFAKTNYTVTPLFAHPNDGPQNN